MNVTWNTSYAAPSPEVMAKIILSAKEVENAEKRELKCPICGYRIQGLYGLNKGHVEVKCRKCKFEGPLNLAYFRRQRRKASVIPCFRSNKGFQYKNK